MKTRRDFIFVEDMIDCVIGAIDKGGHGAYHISSGSDYAIKELFDEAIKAMRINLEHDVEERERSADDAYTILLDPSRVQEEFDWQVSTALGDGVAAAVAWYEKHGVTQTFTHLKIPADG